MEIGIITYHASHNYGSMLQAWAMQTFLTCQGHDVRIINYRSSRQRKKYYKPFDWRSRYSIQSSLKRLFLYPQSILPLFRKWYLFEDFLCRNMRLTKQFNNIKELTEESWTLDCLITGSDQIWNTGTETDGAYFGCFFDGMRISYAPSLGPHPDTCNKDFMRDNLKGFTAVSVRETASRDFLEQYHIADQVKVVCDPTLLLDEKDYMPFIEGNPIIEGEYIFLYTASATDSRYFELAEAFAKRVGLPVVTERAFYPYQIRCFPHIRNHISTGPCEFLNLVKNARYVIGGSFHLLVFSVLFRKDFYCVFGDVDSRTNHLLRVLGLEERIMSLNDVVSMDIRPVEYSMKVWDKLNEYRQYSISFLKANLS